MVKVCGRTACGEEWVAGRSACIRHKCERIERGRNVQGSHFICVMICVEQWEFLRVLILWSSCNSNLSQRTHVLIILGVSICFKGMCLNAMHTSHMATRYPGPEELGEYLPQHQVYIMVWYVHMEQAGQHVGFSHVPAMNYIRPMCCHLMELVTSIGPGRTM